MAAKYISGWAAIAADPLVRTWLNLQPIPEGALGRFVNVWSAGWWHAVRADSRKHTALVLVTPAGVVSAAIELVARACDSERRYLGVSVEIAVAPGDRKRGLGTEVLNWLVQWATAEDAGIHVHADVCTMNVGSTAMIAKAGWRRVEEPDGDCRMATHDCAGKAIRSCANRIHP
jgi:GNAT superfamily N-acetyltransferase